MSKSRTKVHQGTYQVGLHQGAQPQQEGFSQTLGPNLPLRRSFGCGDLSGIYGITKSDVSIRYYKE